MDARLAELCRKSTGVSGAAEEQKEEEVEIVL
jgi:hypothetical protein